MLMPIIERVWDGIIYPFTHVAHWGAVGWAGTIVYAVVLFVPCLFILLVCCLIVLFAFIPNFLVLFFLMFIYGYPQANDGFFFSKKAKIKHSWMGTRWKLIQMFVFRQAGDGQARGYSPLWFTLVFAFSLCFLFWLEHVPYILSLKIIFRLAMLYVIARVLITCFKQGHLMILPMIVLLGAAVYAYYQDFNLLIPTIKAGAQWPLLHYVVGHPVILNRSQMDWDFNRVIYVVIVILVGINSLRWFTNAAWASDGLRRRRDAFFYGIVNSRADGVTERVTFFLPSPSIAKCFRFVWPNMIIKNADSQVEDTLVPPSLSDSGSTQPLEKVPVAIHSAAHTGSTASSEPDQSLTLLPELRLLGFGDKGAKALVAEYDDSTIQAILADMRKHGTEGLSPKGYLLKQLDDANH